MVMARSWRYDFDWMEPGTLLAGRYEIGGALASGGMGVVYSARQLPLGRPVALKLLKRDLLKHGPFLERLRREARIAASLKHPNIVDVTDLVLEPDLAFLVMELLHGESFGNLIGRTPSLVPRVVASIGCDVLSALSAAHSVGLVHRDVKPDNVFIAKITGGETVAKLLDFGLVKVNDAEDGTRLTATNAVLGTWQYMAPEQARGETADARSDIYSLGACLYYALTKKRPYQAADMEASMFALSETPVPRIAELRKDVDPGLCAVIERALDKDRGRRWQSAREMMDALEPYGRDSLSTETASELPTGRRLEAINRAIAAAVDSPAESTEEDHARTLPVDVRRPAWTSEPTMDDGNQTGRIDNIESVEIVPLKSASIETIEPEPESLESAELVPVRTAPPQKVRANPFEGLEDAPLAKPTSVKRFVSLLLIGFVVFAAGIVLGRALFH
jgi:serine/threonine protein kinase